MYDPESAASYWSKDRFEEADDFAAVVGLSTSPKVNRAFDDWEARLLSKLDVDTAVCLDVACGVGRHTVRLAERAMEVVGTDISTEMLRRAHNRAVDAGVNDRIEWRAYPADVLQFPQGVFDLVLCMGLLEHVPSDVADRVLAELIRVTALGGYLLLEVNNKGSKYLGRDDHRIEKQYDNGYFNRLCDPRVVRSELEDSGMHIVREWSNLFYSIARHRFGGHGVGFAAKLDAVLDLPDWMSQTRADHYVMLARKDG